MKKAIINLNFENGMPNIHGAEVCVKVAGNNGKLRYSFDYLNNELAHQIYTIAERVSQLQAGWRLGRCLTLASITNSRRYGIEKDVDTFPLVCLPPWQFAICKVRSQRLKNLNTVFAKVALLGMQALTNSPLS